MLKEEDNNEEELLNENGYPLEFVDAIISIVEHGQFIKPPSQDVKYMLNWLEDEE